MYKESKDMMPSQERQNAWERQGFLLSHIRAEAFTDVAFKPGTRALCCIDGGTPNGDFRSAGSGILTTGESRRVFIESLKAAGIGSVTSHADCGAANVYRQQHGIADQTVDHVAIEQAKLMAEELGVPYAGHITELEREAFHNERVVYVDYRGHFNPKKIDGLPIGFQVSAVYMTPEQAASEVILAIKIAFGDHGFSTMFTPLHPLRIIVLGNGRQQVESMLATFSAEDQKRIQLEVFRESDEQEESIAA